VPVPEAGVPPVAVQEMVTGEVPPDVLAVHIIELPAVPVDGQLAVSIRGCAETVTVAEPDAITLFASLTLNDSVNVPLIGCVTLNVPVPVYGPVPPV